MPSGYEMAVAPVRQLDLAGSRPAFPAKSEWSSGQTACPLADILQVIEHAANNDRIAQNHALKSNVGRHLRLIGYYLRGDALYLCTGNAASPSSDHFYKLFAFLIDDSLTKTPMGVNE